MIRAISILILFASFTAIAQEDSVTFYYDKKWHKTEDQQSAVYYRKAIVKNDLWYVNDYYKKSNRLQMSGSFLLGKGDSLKHGDFVYYYENGWKDEEGKYVNDERTGEWNGWYEKGKKKYQGVYKEGYLVDDYISWYENGAVYCTLHYLNDVGIVRESETTDSTGKKIKRNGKLSGLSVYYYANGKMCAREEWKDGLVRMECWNEQGMPEPAARDSAGNYLVEVLPKFDGDLFQFLIKNTNYPKASRKRYEEGKPRVKFVVEKNGDIVNVVVDKSSGYPLLDEEAVRVVHLMNGKWIPGKEHNFPVKVYYTLPIRFMLR